MLIMYLTYTICLKRYDRTFLKMKQKVNSNLLLLTSSLFNTVALNYALSLYRMERKICPSFIDEFYSFDLIEIHVKNLTHKIELDVEFRGKKNFFLAL